MLSKTFLLFCSVVVAVVLLPTFAAGGRSFFSSGKAKQSKPVAETVTNAGQSPPPYSVLPNGIPSDGNQYDPVDDEFERAEPLEDDQVYQILSLRSFALGLNLPHAPIWFLQNPPDDHHEILWHAEYVEDDDYLVLRSSIAGAGYVGSASVTGPSGEKSYIGHLVQDKESAQRFEHFKHRTKNPGWTYLKAAGLVKNWWLGTSPPDSSKKGNGVEFMYYYSVPAVAKYPVFFSAVTSSH